MIISFLPIGIIPFNCVFVLFVMQSGLLEPILMGGDKHFLMFLKKSGQVGKVAYVYILFEATVVEILLFWTRLLHIFIIISIVIFFESFVSK